MNRLAAFQQTQLQFAAHLRDPEANAAPAGIEDRRMKIYRELIFNNIESFLTSGFPVLRSLMEDNEWHRLVRDFVSRHQSQTPYFLEISQEFLVYLREECDCLPKQLPFILELAHYEWVELALDVSSVKIPQGLDKQGDLLSGHPMVSPLAWRLSYQYPVHKLGPSYQPLSPPEQPTYLVVYRTSLDEVKFLESNAVTIRLLQLLDDDSDMTAEDALRQIAKELGRDDLGAIFSFGNQLLNELMALEILVGVSRV